MSTRLTMEMRDAIQQKLITRAFDAREKAQAAEKAALADAVYNDIYPAKVQAIMEGLPKDFFPYDNDLKVSFHGEVVNLRWGREARRVAHGHQYSVATIYPKDHKLTKRYDAWKKAERELTAEKDKAKSRARALLKSVTTIKRLIAVWPEVKPFVEVYENQPGRGGLPAIPMGELNKSLNLEAVK